MDGEIVSLERRGRAWERETSEPEIGGFGAYLQDADETFPQGFWVVGLAAAEFLHEFSPEEEEEIRDAVLAALKAVPGVENAGKRDRTLWWATGSPDGRSLVEAASGVIDRFADEARAIHEDWG